MPRTEDALAKDLLLTRALLDAVARNAARGAAPYPGAGGTEETVVRAEDLPEPPSPDAVEELIAPGEDLSQRLQTLLDEGTIPEAGADSDAGRRFSDLAGRLKREGRPVEALLASLVVALQDDDAEAVALMLDSLKEDRPAVIAGLIDLLAVAGGRGVGTGLDRR
ncbi:MAG: hypothetical protein GEU28_09520 [Dehalococcoidia bacterium]|nr:hypothetical protein [Dehalococcoidia bacterium]